MVPWVCPGEVMSQGSQAGEPSRPQEEKQMSFNIQAGETEAPSWEGVAFVTHGHKAGP